MKWEVPVIKGIKNKYEKSIWNLDIGEWSDGINVTFTPDGVRTYFGFKQLLPDYTFPEQILWISTINEDILFFGCRNVYWSQNGATPQLTNWINIDPKATYWSECETPNWVLFTNGIEKPKYWDTANKEFVELTDAPIARLFWYQDRHLLATAISGAYNKIQWSDLDDPTNWSSGEAGYGYFDLGSTDIPLCVANISGNFYIIANRGVWLIRYVGYPIYWEVRPVFVGLGIISSKCISEFGDESLFIGNDMFYFCDGYNLKPMENGITRQFFLEVDPNHLEKIFSIFDEYQRHVLIFYNKNGAETVDTWHANTDYNINDLVIPSYDKGLYYRCIQAGTSGDSEPTWPHEYHATVEDGTVIWRCEGALEYTDKAILYNYDLGYWNELDLGQIQAAGFWRVAENILIDDFDFLIDEWNSLIDAKNFTFNFPTLIFVKNDGKLYQLDYNKVVDKESYLITGYIPLEEHKLTKLRKYIISIQIQGQGETNVYVGTIESINATPIWHGPYKYTFQKDEKIELADYDLNARYIVLKFQNVNKFFEIYGYVIEYEEVGEE